MKRLIALLAAVGFASVISFSAQANWATQAGPLVQCQFGDGSSDYIPTLVCTVEGGTFTRNPGNQW